jgi:hypothetical protein
MIQELEIRLSSRDCQEIVFHILLLLGPVLTTEASDEIINKKLFF